MCVLGKIINFSVYGIYYVLLFRVYVFIVFFIHFQVLFVFPGSLETAVTEGGGTHQYIGEHGSPRLQRIEEEEMAALVVLDSSQQIAFFTGPEGARFLGC